MSKSPVFSAFSYPAIAAIFVAELPKPWCRAPKSPSTIVRTSVHTSLQWRNPDHDHRVHNFSCERVLKGYDLKSSLERWRTGNYRNEASVIMRNLFLHLIHQICQKWLKIMKNGNKRPKTSKMAPPKGAFPLKTPQITCFFNSGLQSRTHRGPTSSSSGAFLNEHISVYKSPTFSEIFWQPIKIPGHRLPKIAPLLIFCHIYGAWPDSRHPP